MEKLIFTVRDNAAEAHLEPFFARSKNEAMRSFGDAVNKEGHPFNVHPEDYVLYHIGVFDEGSGQVMSVDHVSLGKAAEFFNNANVGVVS